MPLHFKLPSLNQFNKPTKKQPALQETKCRLLFGYVLFALCDIQQLLCQKTAFLHTRQREEITAAEGADVFFQWLQIQ